MCAPEALKIALLNPQSFNSCRPTLCHLSRARQAKQEIKKKQHKKTVKAQRGGVKTADGKEDDRGLGGLKGENKAKHVWNDERGGKNESRNSVRVRLPAKLPHHSGLPLPFSVSLPARQPVSGVTQSFKRRTSINYLAGALVRCGSLSHLSRLNVEKKKKNSIDQDTLQA